MVLIILRFFVHILRQVSWLVVAVGSLSFAWAFSQRFRSICRASEDFELPPFWRLSFRSHIVDKVARLYTLHEASIVNDLAKEPQY